MSLCSALVSLFTPLHAHAATALACERVSDGATPLFIAAMQGQGTVVQLLLDGGAAVNEATNRGDKPLSMAVRGGHEEVAALLRAAGATE